MQQTPTRWPVPLLLLADVGVAGLLALLVFRMVGAVSQADTNPPVCTNDAGNVVSCAMTPGAVMLPTFLVVLLLLVGYQLLGRRRRR